MAFIASSLPPTTSLWVSESLTTILTKTLILPFADEENPACAGTVNGQPAVVLSWGIDKSDGASPDGCDRTSVSKRCNVPGSTAKCPKF